MLQPLYPIRTARLLIRPYTDADFDDLYDIQSRPEVARYLYWSPRDRAEVRRSLEERKRVSFLVEEGQGLTLAVELREAECAAGRSRTGRGTVIGDVLLLWTSRQHRQGEVGYIFHPDYGGRGYATEAAEVMLQLGFEQLGLHRIIGRLDARNQASARVLERLGMRREAHFVQNEFVKGEWTDELVYAILATEWRTRTARRPA